MSQSSWFRRLITSPALAAACVFAALSAPNAFAIIASTPVVTSIARLQPGPLTNSSTVTWRVTFSESVTGVDATDFTLTPLDGSATGTISAASGSGSEYTVTVSSLSGIGTLRLDVKSSGTGIASATSTALSGGFTYGQTYTHVPGSAPISWGDNEYGQLGTNATSESLLPTGVSMVDALRRKSVVAVATGGAHSLALTSDGQVYAWGSNNRGQLGNGLGTDSAVPVAVPSAAFNGATVIAIAAGLEHSLALTDDGRIFAWGAGFDGRLGIGGGMSIDGLISTIPVAVVDSGALAGKKAVAIGAGATYSLALTSDGRVFAWGTGASLGQGPVTQTSFVPVAVGAGLEQETVTAVSAGTNHVLALASDGQIFAWGNNDYGQLGNGSIAAGYVPAPVTSGALEGKPVTAISAGREYSLVLSSDTRIIAWGFNSDGQLGNNTTAQSTLPVMADMSGALSGRQVVALVAGGTHSKALAADGAIFTWGDSTHDRSGNWTSWHESRSLVPVMVDTTETNNALAGRVVYALETSSGHNHAIVLASFMAATGVSGPSGGLYRVGMQLDFAVRFPQAVTVDTTSGTPRIALTVGSTTRYATYASGTGTTALTFSYTVQAGDADTDGIAITSTAIDLNSGSLTDIAGNVVDLTLPTLDASGIKIDTAAPDTSITSTPAASTNGSSASFAFTGSDTGGSGVASYQVQLDDGGFSAAASPVSYSGLALGSHTFQVRAVDAAGNTDATPATYIWTVTATTPVSDGYAATATGGGATSAVSVSTKADFVTQATSSSASVITVVGSLDIGTVAVASNKTIQGADRHASLSGCLQLNGVSNVIIRGLSLSNPDGHALQLTGASHVFVTHCTFFDCAGRQILAGNSDNVTISWCAFGADTPGQVGVQIGTEGDGAAGHFTLHHNGWFTNMGSALPQITSGYVHQYCDAVRHPGNTSGTMATGSAQLFSERNVYETVHSPLTQTGAGVVRVLDNIYTSCTGTGPVVGDGSVFTPTYSYALLAVGDVYDSAGGAAGNTTGAAYVDDPVGSARITASATTVNPGASFTLTAVPTGVSATGYQWRLNNAPIAGATSGTYAVSSMSSAHVGTYTVALALANGDAVVSTPVALVLGTGATPGGGTNPGGNTNPGSGSGSSSSSSGGGGGALGLWFLAALALLAEGRRRTRCRS